MADHADGMVEPRPFAHVHFGSTARAGRPPCERQIADRKADARTLRRNRLEWVDNCHSSGISVIALLSHMPHLIDAVGF